jgi:hypothetical protein
VFDDENVIRRSDAQHQSTFYKLFLPCFTQSVCIAYLCMLVTDEIEVCRQNHVPLERHNILTWFPISGFVNESKVGPKNIASSSGCAMSSNIRLPVRDGNDLAINAVYIQKKKKSTGTDAHIYHCMLATQLASGL